MCLNPKQLVMIKIYTMVQNQQTLYIYLSIYIYNGFTGMVHLIYKLYLKAIFLCVKFNGAIGFSEKHLFLT